MNLQDIVFTSSGALFIVLCLVEISPLKLNPWKKIGSAIGHIVNGSLEEKIDNMSKEISTIKNRIDDLQENINQNEAINCRNRILQFGDEILHGMLHSKDRFDQTFIDIKTYNNYCNEHPNFENNVTGMTVERIKNVYRELLKKNDFI